MSGRFKVIIVFFLLICLIMVGRLFELQVLGRDFYINKKLRIEKIPSERGEILIGSMDNLYPLAINTTRYDLIASPINIKDKENITIKSKIAICKNCGNELFNEEYEKENQQKVYNIFRENNNLLYPNEIYEIRKKYGLTQKEMSELLGWGEITYHRYENGSLPDQAHNKQLLLLKNPRNAKEILNNTKHNLSKEKEIYLNNKIEELITEKSDTRDIKITLPEDVYEEINIEASKMNMNIETYSRILIIKRHYKSIIEKTNTTTKYEIENKMLKRYNIQKINYWNDNNGRRDVLNNLKTSFKAKDELKGVY